MNSVINKARRVLVGAAAAGFAIVAVGGTGASIASAAHSPSHITVVTAKSSGWGS